VTSTFLRPSKTGIFSICDAKLLDETRTSGIGVTRVCEACGHQWYINKKIKTCKCLTCRTWKRSADKRKSVTDVLDETKPDDKIDCDSNATYNESTGADKSRWASRTSNPLGGANNAFGGFDSHALPPDSLSASPSRDRQRRNYLTLNTLCQKERLIDLFVKSRRNGLLTRTIDKYRLYLRLADEVIGLNVTGQDVQRFIASRSSSPRMAKLEPIGRSTMGHQSLEYRRYVKALRSKDGLALQPAHFPAYLRQHLSEARR
jgi:hypothetical protein